MVIFCRFLAIFGHFWAILDPRGPRTPFLAKLLEKIEKFPAKNTLEKSRFSQNPGTPPGKFQFFAKNRKMGPPKSDFIRSFLRKCLFLAIFYEKTQILAKNRQFCHFFGKIMDLEGPTYIGALSWTFLRPTNRNFQKKTMPRIKFLKIY